MRVRRTIHCSKSKHFLFIELYCLTWCKIVCCNNTRFCHLTCSVAHSAENIKHTLGNVLHVGCTSLHICIIHRCKHLCKVISCCRNSILCIYTLCTDNSFNRFQIIQIIKHHLVNLKDHGVGLTYIFNGFVVKVFQLVDCCVLSLFESLPFRIHVIHMCSSDHLFVSLIEHQLSNGYSTKYAFSFNRYHIHKSSLK